MRLDYVVREGERNSQKHLKTKVKASESAGMMSALS